MNNDQELLAALSRTNANLEALNEQLIADFSRMNANLEALLAASQGQLLAQLVDVLRDLRQIAAGTLGYKIKRG